MSYEIPIINDAGVEVCRVAWDGDLYSGKAQVVPLDNYQAEAVNVSNMILARDDLKEMRFRSEGERYHVMGWRGYGGTVGALRVMLPALGFLIGHIGGDMPPVGKQRKEEISFNSDQGGIE